MICHAKRINQKHAENARIEEMERRVFPLAVVIVVLLCWALIIGISEDLRIRNEWSALKEAIVHLANGGTAAVGEDAIIKCQVTELVKGVEK